MYEDAFQLQMIDDQTAAFHMKDLHACARLVDEDERVSVLYVETHLVCDDAAQRVESLAHVRRMQIQEESVGVCKAEHPLLPYRYQLAEYLCGDISRQADSHAVGKDDFSDGMSHFHRVHPLSAGKDNFPHVVVDAHWKELTIPVRCLLADLRLPVIEVAFIHPDLSAEGPDRHVALKKGLICRPECVYRFHTVLFYEPQSYSGGVMRKRRGLPNAYALMTHSLPVKVLVELRFAHHLIAADCVPVDSKLDCYLPQR